MGAEEAQKKGDDETSDHGADPHSDKKRGLHIGRDSAVLVKIVRGLRGCGRDRGRREQKRKPAGGVPVETAEKARR